MCDMQKIFRNFSIFTQQSRKLVNLLRVICEKRKLQDITDEFDCESEREFNYKYNSTYV